MGTTSYIMDNIKNMMNPNANLNASLISYPEFNKFLGYYDSFDHRIFIHQHKIYLLNGGHLHGYQSRHQH